MIRRLTLLVGVLALAALFVPAARAGQEEGNWEFHAFGARAQLDSQDPLARVRALSGDVDGDGSASPGTFTRSSTFDDNLFMGFRLGYVWSKRVETEFDYDRNHTGGDYRHVIDDAFSGRVEEVRGRISAVFTSYQFGMLYHPLGARRTPWQPYVTVSAGYIDVDFEPAKSIEGRVRGGLAGSVFAIDFPRGDQNWLLGYGAGLKYFLAPNVALRGEVRGKSYELFSERRNDREISFGISFFAPGTY